MQANIVVKPKEEVIPPKPVTEVKKASIISNLDKANKIPDENWYTAYTYF